MVANATVLCQQTASGCIPCGEGRTSASEAGSEGVTPYSVHPLPRSMRANGGIINDLGALGPWCCVFHNPGAASDVRKLTWKKHLHSTLASGAVPGFAQPAQPLDEGQPCHWAPICRAGLASPPAEARKEEINLPSACKQPEAAVQLLRREKML